ncbi:carboxylic acid reductase [Smaragdicoccus niigatensis]|uniref:carboxylic acid reductase n=1 Tax=Smaragdicoccus niigatensis TaxID=359359 RepID=UPI00036B1AE4|nr:carboxylic acid reductase [Smaragdicoccus niigatensis]
MSAEARNVSAVKERIAQLYAEEPELRAAVPLPEISAAIREPGTSLAQSVETVMTGYADRPAVGFRTDDEFTTVSYAELWARVNALAAAWQADSIRPGDLVAILGFTGLDYTIVDLTCVHRGAVSVPLQTSAAQSQLAAILAETEPRILATSAEHLDDAVTLVLSGFAPERLLVFDAPTPSALVSARQRLASSTVTIDTLDEALARGRSLEPVDIHIGNDDELSLIIYTSGSTGTPKGAMYTERLVKVFWTAPPPQAAININYSPMSHVLGRFTLYGVLARGGTANFTSQSDLSTLFTDIALVRPTELTLVPRVCDMVYQRYQAEISRRPDADIKTELREQFFGGRVINAACGSAPLAPEMRKFIESVLDVPLHDGYGSTEAGPSVVINNKVRRPPVIDYRLVDVPELGYFVTDQPHPRGELLLKTTAMIPGYYKRPDVTAEMFDADGFYLTGDIVAETGPDELVYLDRRNNVLKLSQGEFVTVAAVEAALSTSPLIRQIYVYGSSERAYLLAVIVPTDPSTPRSEISASIAQAAQEAELQPYEIPRDFIIETEPFSGDNGLLSGIGKLLRPKLKAHYGEKLEQLYAQHVQAHDDEMAAIRSGADSRPVLETVVRSVAAILDSSDIPTDVRFVDLGGDSLSALTLSNLLHDVFGVDVPVGVVNHPANDIAQLARYVEEKLAAPTSLPDVVHPDPDVIRASELQLEKFIDRQTLDSARSLPMPSGPVRTVLLTGANGYLGRFLCLEWLQRLKPVGGRVVCIIRGSAARLESVFESDPAFLAQFRELSEGCLEVVSGDVAEANLGLDEATWDRLAGQVDLVVHSAALVNHVLPYRQLFGPNVFGTAEIIRFAMSERLKPISFVSTVAVAAQCTTFDEDGDIREMSPSRSVGPGYANGYGNSKWASEVLLREANDWCGLPVTVFRSDMILAHPQFAGQLNVPDIFTRLLLSLASTGLAPQSFYRRGDGHYDGLPADFVARAITDLGLSKDGFRTFNVLNNQGASLDQFVDWLIDAGQPIHRIDDYREWFGRFESQLRGMPESVRDHTLLPLLQAFAKPAGSSSLPADRFREAIGDLPTVTAELIAKYVADLRLLGLLTH